MEEFLEKTFLLNTNQATIFSSAFKEITIPKNDWFIRSGEVTHKIGFIKKGLMKCVYIKDGKEVVDEFAFENNFVTNYYSFLKEEKSDKEIICLEDSTVYVITREKLAELGEEYPFVKDMARIMSEQLFFSVNDKVRSLRLDSAEERYLKLRLNREELVQRIPQYLLASYLNVQPETISRIRKRIIEQNDLDLSQ